MKAAIKTEQSWRIKPWNGVKLRGAQWIEIEQAMSRTAGFDNDWTIYGAQGDLGLRSEPSKRDEIGRLGVAGLVYLEVLSFKF